MNVHRDFSARLRVNGYNHCGPVPEKFGGDSFRFGGGLGSCHTFNTLMPPDEFFDAHPEYFSFENADAAYEPEGREVLRPQALMMASASSSRAGISEDLRRLCTVTGLPTISTSFIRASLSFITRAAQGAQEPFSSRATLRER